MVWWIDDDDNDDGVVNWWWRCDDNNNNDDVHDDDDDDYLSCGYLWLINIFDILHHQLNCAPFNINNNNTLHLIELVHQRREVFKDSALSSPRNHINFTLQTKIMYL